MSTMCSDASFLSAVKINVPPRTYRPNRKIYRPIFGIFLYRHRYIGRPLGVTVKNTIRRSEIKPLMHSGKQEHKYLVLISFLGEDVSYERLLNLFLFEQILPQPSDGPSGAPARPENQTRSEPLHKTLVTQTNHHFNSQGTYTANNHSLIENKTESFFCSVAKSK